MSVDLPALRGRNPLGLFAALGALDVATRLLHGTNVKLHWTQGLEPHAVLSGIGSLDQLVTLCDQDRERWMSSPVLTWPASTPLADLKPSLPDLRDWIAVTAAAYRESRDPVDVRLLSALVAEGAAAGKNDAKPTDFHFTAGQQRFLTMIRDLRDNVDASRLEEGLAGPWRYDSTLPVMGWDARGERIWALRGPDPSSEKKTGVPGADWLAFLGLSFFPVALGMDRYGQRRLTTTGCEGPWKSGTFTWPLWSVPLGTDVIRSLLADTRLSTLGRAGRLRLGVSDLLRAGIRRTDQGGYGSFGPPGPAPESVRTLRRRGGSHAARH